MQKTCKQCAMAFSVTADDLAFYDKVSPVFNGKKESIPPPPLCPECRMRSRLTFRNELSLFRRPCSKCKKEMICMFASDASYSVYCHDCWWSEDFDALHSGRDIDLSRSFFAQLSELIALTPLPHLVIGDCENSDFTNYSWQNRNSYLLSSSDYNEDCYFSTYLFRSVSCTDCTFVSDCELCYECVDVKQCYRSSFLQNCQNCSDCLLCYDCHSCTDCIGCVGLRNKHHYILNKQYSKEDFEREKGTMKQERLQSRFETLKMSFPREYADIEQCEASSGDHLRSCKNARHCFDLVEAQDCAYCALGLKPKDCQDCTGVPGSELSYQVAACPENYSLQFSAVIWPKSAFLQYCLFSRSSNRCFGCISLHKNEYCILNKQYTKEEYEKLVPQIIEKMRGDGEWGEFFPVELSPFAYNETVAQEYFPLTKEEVLKRGWKWRDETDEMPKVSKVIPASQLPDSIDDIPDDILNWAIRCEATKRPFKIIKQELEFYRKMRFPVPHFHPDERHKRRMALRNPRKLWQRKCAKCRKGIETTYAPDRPEIVYCEECYLKEVY
ncbi:MAG: hypothetical protein PHW10_00185 [Candidatus Peribacteraceae bacterium]|nr:hypothetical protein [Candidatus Peribacteraceae bacterium]